MPRQSDLRFTFEPERSPARFDVIEFHLEEGLSTPFKLTLELSSHDANVDFAGLLDNAALLTLWRHDEPVRFVHGLVSSVTVGQSGFRRTRYRIVVEPHLARLGLCSNWRIFQQLTVPQIIDRILGQHHVFDREQVITAPHQPREYCVQAGETDLRFLARLAAEEGLVYTFKHSARGHRLVHTDRVTGIGMIGPSNDCAVIYDDNPGGDQQLPCITRFDYTEQVLTARQVQRDYTFTHPRYNLEHEAAGRDLQRQSGTYERFDYPGRYKRDAAGKPFTQTRILALRNGARMGIAVGDDTRLRPGLGFDIAEHPREAFNDEWRAIRVAHHGIQHSSQEEDAGDNNLGTRYTQTAHVIDGRTEWKADLLEKPRIDGTQTATVVGPPGEEIHCDEWGRVKLSFPWDRDSKNDDSSSCWVRVSQGWAGTTWGAMAIPRIGQEMIVAYMDGDPDQPLIIGRTYRAANLPPYALPQHKTRMTIKSQSHKGRGFNELRFEDELGQEEVFIHAQKDQNNVVKHNETTKVGNDRSERVEHNEHISIGDHRTEDVGQNEIISIGANRSVTIGANKAETIGIAKVMSIGAAYQTTVGVAMNTSVGLSQSEQVGVHKSVVVGNRFSITAGDEFSITVGKSTLVMKSDGSIVINGSTFDFSATGPVQINGKDVDIN